MAASMNPILLQLCIVTSVWHLAHAQRGAPVAFSATKTENMAGVSTDTPITFNVIDVNEGGAFDGTTFVAPVTGIYLLTFTVKSYDVTVNLKNFTVIERSTTYTDLVHRNADNMVSNAVTIRLYVGNRIQLHLSNVSSTGLIHDGEEDGFYTSFSGVLLDPEDSYDGSFSASLRMGNRNDVEENTVVLFDTVEEDWNNHFDSQYYRIPHTGVYLFTFTGKGDEMSVHLKVGQTIRRSASTCMSGISEENTASNVYIVPLNYHDAASLQHGAWGDDMKCTWGDPAGPRFCSLTGSLLFKINTADADAPSQGAQMANTDIAFTVTRTTNMEPVNETTVVTYDKIDGNVGGGFDLGDMASFVAPRAGHYMFFFSVKSDKAAVHLQVNEVTRRSAIVNDPSGCAENMAMNSVIVHLRHGDKVQVVLSPYGGSGLIEENPSGGVFTSFSGFMIYEHVA